MIPWPPAGLDGEPVPPSVPRLPPPPTAHPRFGTACPACGCFAGPEGSPGYREHVWACCASLRDERDDAIAAFAALMAERTDRGGDPVTLPPGMRVITDPQAEADRLATARKTDPSHWHLLADQVVEVADPDVPGCLTLARVTVTASTPRVARADIGDRMRQALTETLEGTPE